MNNEFDFKPDFDFEDDFDEELEGFDDDFDEDEDDEITTRTAVLKKNGMVALLSVKTAGDGSTVCRVDPREDRPSVQFYDDSTAAIHWFTRSLKTSKRNGWEVVYDGLPLQG
jgi:hypothetical protein